MRYMLCSERRMLYTPLPWPGTLPLSAASFRAVLRVAKTLVHLFVPSRYLNNSGFQWETAAQMDAVLVFAEHRYYGKSKPFEGEELWQNMQYLSTDQALVRRTV